ncbi:MAG: integrase arm-type DNA-binding domain-containing protein [Syntrophorhabdaceae bacterium]|nr:integrase arm-type DNA-binding domain-containing protein [Syntrophorhabdaceae bacterium]
MKLTDVFLRKLKPSGKDQKISDGGGLYIHVSAAGGKLWRMAYRFKGKQKTLSIGAYPAVSLVDARRQRQDAKVLIVQGIDPSAHKKAVKASIRAETENTFEVVAREWYSKYKDAWADSHGKKIITRLENDIFPLVGSKIISSVTAPELLEALRRIEARGAIETAHRAMQNCGQIFRYAIATGRAERDTAADLRGALSPAKPTNLASITEPKAIGALLRDIDAYPGNLIVRAALRMAPYVFVRPGELRRAEWSEFNMEAAEWRIPSSRMKMGETHIVPLAGQVQAILGDLRRYTGHCRYLFPSMRADTNPISDVCLLAALRRMGYDKDTMTVHGFRSMASTLLNEQGYNRDWIERQLAHSERNSVRAAYNYAQHLPERRRMMQEWADYLDGLRVQAGPC